MTQLLNDDIYTKIMSSNDEEYIFEVSIPLLPQISKCFVDNIDIFIPLAKRVFSIIDKIFTLFLVNEEIEKLPNERKNEILNVKSCTELVVSKLNNNNIDLSNKELNDSINIVFEFFNKANQEQKELNNNLKNLNNTLDQGTKDILENLFLKKISDYCVENISKPKNQLDMEKINSYINEITVMIKNSDPVIINNLLADFRTPVLSKENIKQMKAYNMITTLRILINLKN